MNATNTWRGFEDAMDYHEAKMSTRVDDEQNEEMTEPSGVHRAPPHVPGPDEGGLSRGAWIGIAVVALVILFVVVKGIHSRDAAEDALAKQTAAAAIPSVNVVYPTVSTMSSELALPGNTQAYTDTPIYSRTNGYLKQWFFDIGAHVRKGQLMAIIETPEIDQQLQVAQADLKSAEANLALANTTSARYQNLLKTNSVSKQETDQAVSDAAAKQAAVDASMANVRRLEKLQSFEKVYAPFDGIVTARNTDIGALIAAGENSTPKELFHMAAIGKLRVYVAVPESYAPSIKDGAKATLTLDEYPGQKFTGTIARNSSAIDPASRTLNVEVDVDNPNGKLLPGAYVFVHFKVPVGSSSLMLPADTLLFRAEGLRVGVVRDGRAHLAPVTISKDAGATVEISSGLTAQDQVILDPSDSLTDGQQVMVANHPAPPSGEQAKAGTE